jgi:hypothetical protein
MLTPAPQQTTAGRGRHALRPCPRTTPIPADPEPACRRPPGTGAGSQQPPAPPHGARHRHVRHRHGRLRDRRRAASGGPQSRCLDKLGRTPCHSLRCCLRTRRTHPCRRRRAPCPANTPGVGPGCVRCGQRARRGGAQLCTGAALGAAAALAVRLWLPHVQSPAPASLGRRLSVAARPSTWPLLLQTTLAMASGLGLPRWRQLLWSRRAGTRDAPTGTGSTRCAESGRAAGSGTLSSGPSAGGRLSVSPATGSPSMGSGCTWRRSVTCG